MCVCVFGHWSAFQAESGLNVNLNACEGSDSLAAG